MPSGSFSVQFVSLGPGAGRELENSRPQSALVGLKSSSTFQRTGPPIQFGDAIVRTHDQARLDSAHQTLNEGGARTLRDPIPGACAITQYQNWAVFRDTKELYLDKVSFSVSKTCQRPL